MGVVKVSFTFPKSTYELLKSEIPARKRSRYVAEKIKEDLRRKRAANVFKRCYGMLKDSGPKEWETEESTRKWIRKMRESDRKRLEELWK